MWEGHPPALPVEWGLPFGLARRSQPSMLGGTARPVGACQSATLYDIILTLRDLALPSESQIPRRKATRGR
jgi:hypothetical protein